MTRTRIHRLPGFEHDGRRFRGNLHCHSTLSDGRVSPEAVVAAYKDASYDFICLSDHFEPAYDWVVADTRCLRDEEFTTIIGAEMSSADWRDPNVYWVSAIGLPVDFAPPSHPESKEDAIRRARAHGAFVILLHPALNNFPLEVAADLDTIDAVEIYNHNISTTFPDAADGRYILDGMLERRRALLANAGDDAHFDHPWDRFGAWIEVQAEELGPDALLRALHRGAYYSTQGPALHQLWIGGGRLHVGSSDARSIAISGGGCWQNTARVLGHGVSEAVFDLTPYRKTWCRVTVVDDERRRAWSNPIWLDEDLVPIEHRG